MSKHEKQMELAGKCFICNSSDYIIKYQKNGYNICRCSYCRVGFVENQPSNEVIQSIYGINYFKRGNKYGLNNNGVEQHDPNTYNNLKKIAFIKEHCETGDLLDIGCATGGFLNLARDHGYTGKGIEISNPAYQYAKKAYQLDVINTDLEKANFSCNSFDIVTMWDVIEHLKNPVAVFKEICRILKPKGYVAFSTGDFDSLWSKIAGSRWQLLTPPQHLFYFNKYSLKYIIEESNLKVIKVSYLGKIVTLDFLLFKASESFGAVVIPFKKIVDKLVLGNRQIPINLKDIAFYLVQKS